MDANKVVTIIGGPYNDHVAVCSSYQKVLTLTTFDVITEETKTIKLPIEYGYLPNGTSGWFVLDDRK